VFVKNEERKFHSHISAQLLGKSDILVKTLTCDEAWDSQYDLEIKCQNLQWESRASPRKKKEERLSKSNVNLTLLCFYIKTIIQFEFVPVAAVNQTFNLKD
jgi:hypothetical protein